MRDQKATLIWVSIFAGIVIIPTICLLWFMEQAIRNERVTIKQKVSQIYKDRIDDFKWEINHFLELPENIDLNSSIHNLVKSLQNKSIDGAVIFEKNKQLYPHNRVQPKNLQIQNSTWNLEYIKKDFNKAGKLYLKQLQTSSIASDSITSLMGAARCFKKAGDTTEAIKTYQKIVESFTLTDSTEQICYATIALVKLLKSSLTDTTLIKMLQPNFEISSSVRQFMLKSSITILNELNCGIKCDSTIKVLKKDALFENTSNLFLPTCQDSSFFDNYNPQKLYQQDSLFFYYTEHGEKKIIQILKKKRFESWLNSLTTSFKTPGITLHLIDEQGITIAGESINKEKPFYSKQMSDMGNKELTLEFCLNSRALYPANIKDQRSTIIWIGVLSILFLIITGAVALSYFLQQSRLNQLKNTFLATVTHELKTPISSCRILIDTLLEEKVTKPEKIKEYYQLIAQENIRLSRLIDTFLTFSRMERNKQIFDFTDTPLSSIINPAIDSMSVKFNDPNCNFTYNNNCNNIEINANEDSLITVITNLLDNAYKYSNTEKEIILTTDIDKNYLIVKISDNGIGIPKKEINRIFNKFYQINQKLSRQVEGCGLGLSIVQYIVNAHNGTIEVESQEHVGSTFTIKLPIKR